MQGLGLLNVIEEIVEKGHGNLHLLATSRNEANIRSFRRRLSNPPRELDVEKPLLVDLDLSFDNMMHNSQALKRLGRDTKTEIRDRLMAGEQR